MTLPMHRGRDDVDPALLPTAASARANAPPPARARRRERSTHAGERLSGMIDAHTLEAKSCAGIRRRGSPGAPHMSMKSAPHSPRLRLCAIAVEA